MRYRALIISAIGIALIGGGVAATQKKGNQSLILRPFSQNPLEYAEVSTTSRPTNTSDTLADSVDLPILVYHIVRPSDPSDSEAVRQLALTPESFDAQMSYLKTAGYTVVQFSDLERYFTDGTPLPPHPIIITFDDAWSDQFEYAFPILVKHGYTATFFVFTNAMDRPGFFTWDNVRTMLASGMTIGNHSRSHPYLNTIGNQAALRDEILGSKQLLERQLGVPIAEFAYPFGQYNPWIRKMVEEAGYKSARGDFYTGLQTKNRLFELSAMNVPTTIAPFMKRFPPKN